MENLPENSMGSMLRRTVRKLCNYKIKSEYGVKLSIYEGEDESSPKCSHSMQGSSKHSIVKIIAVAAAVSLAICAISSLASLCSKD